MRPTEMHQSRQMWLIHTAYIIFHRSMLKLACIQNPLQYYQMPFKSLDELHSFSAKGFYKFGLYSSMIKTTNLMGSNEDLWTSKPFSLWAFHGLMKTHFMFSGHLLIWEIIGLLAIHGETTETYVLDHCTIRPNYTGTWNSMQVDFKVGNRNTFIFWIWSRDFVVDCRLLHFAANQVKFFKIL